VTRLAGVPLVSNATYLFDVGGSILDVRGPLAHLQRWAPGSRTSSTSSVVIPLSRWLSGRRPDPYPVLTDGIVDAFMAVFAGDAGRCRGRRRWTCGSRCGPCGLPLACDPRMGRESMGFPLSFAPRRYRRRT
jgi:hypothetical protein